MLSFAQYERELTGERIRDKIDASKKKGMGWWNCSFGIYDAKERKLTINLKNQNYCRSFWHFIETESSLKQPEN